MSPSDIRMRQQTSPQFNASVTTAIFSPFSTVAHIVMLRITLLNRADDHGHWQQKCCSLCPSFTTQSGFP